MAGQTLYDKIWNDHVIKNFDEHTALIYIDRQLVHEVTSPQAFEGLSIAKRDPWRIKSNLGVADHNVPTVDREAGIKDPISKLQVDTLSSNCKKYGIDYFGMDDTRQGIVHVIGPEQGFTLPGMTIVCGDSHTSTHGAFGALAFGIGTSEVEHVLATQTLGQTKTKTMRINVDGELMPGVGAKDVVLAIIAKIGTAGGNGYTLEFAGEVIRKLSMEGRMTICNMSIEAGARAGLIAVDDTTIEYIKNRPYAPKGDNLALAIEAWRHLQSDTDAVFDQEVFIDGSTLLPQISWGTSPEMVIAIDELVPNPEQATTATKASSITKALEYMNLKAGIKASDIYLDKIFIGSCTNARLEDLRAVAQVVKGKKIAANIKQAMVVPGSGLVKLQAEKEGLHTIFLEAGFEWRQPGCSMCLAMNADRLEPGERCASTSNRNFEGRQGKGGRTHLVSPMMAGAAAIAGHFVDVRDVL